MALFKLFSSWRLAQNEFLQKRLEIPLFFQTVKTMLIFKITLSSPKARILRLKNEENLRYFFTREFTGVSRPVKKQENFRGFNVSDYAVKYSLPNLEGSYLQRLQSMSEDPTES